MYLACEPALVTYICTVVLRGSLLSYRSNKDDNNIDYDSNYAYICVLANLRPKWSESKPSYGYHLSRTRH